MKIRQETPADYQAVHALVQQSFAASPHGDGTEADYLNDVRKKDTFIAQLSLVAENDEGQIIGQIVLYETTITGQDKDYVELVLSPICVHPDYFRQGIARAMMQKAFTLAKDMGYNAVFLCGDPDLYGKLGFRPSYVFHIYHITDKAAEWSMALELNQGALAHIEGTIHTL